MFISVRMLALASLVTASVAAHAATFVFDFSSKGSFALATGSYSVTDTVLSGAGSDASTMAVAGVSYNYFNSPATSGTGTITLVDTSTIDFTFVGGITTNNPNSNALNGAVISFGSGTGSLAGLAGLGSISNTLRWTAGSPGDRGDSRSTFYGELEAVPEPASMAALALGFAALAKKRRK